MGTVTVRGREEERKEVKGGEHREEGKWEGWDIERKEWKGLGVPQLSPP